jgi:hypothetical protein
MKVERKTEFFELQDGSQSFHTGELSLIGSGGIYFRPTHEKFCINTSKNSLLLMLKKAIEFEKFYTEIYEVNTKTTYTFSEAKRIVKLNEL